MLTRQTEGKKPTAELSVREALVVRGLVAGLTAKAALIEAGYSASTAEKKSGSIVGRGRVLSVLRDAMEKEGLTTEQIAKTIHRGLNAKRIQRILVKDTVREFTDIDHATPHRYLETACRLRGEDSDKETIGTCETFEDRIRRLRGVMAKP